MRGNMGKRLFALSLSILMMLAFVPGISEAAYADRSPQKLDSAISSIDIVSQTGVSYVKPDGSVEFNTNGIYRFEVKFDLTKYNGNLVNGDYFTLTIPAPIHVKDQSFTLTDEGTGVEIATCEVVSNGKSQGGTATITLQKLEEYLEKTNGETVRDVSGTFYVDFSIYEEVEELKLTYEITETINQITHTITATDIEETDSTDRIGKTNFEKRLNKLQEEPFYSETLGRTLEYQARWIGRINVNQKSYDRIVITDTIDIEEHAPMQFIPEMIKLEYGYFNTGYVFQSDGELVQGADYTIEYNSSYTEFVITILNPSAFNASNEQPAAFYLTAPTSIPADGSEVQNSLTMTADDQVMTETTVTEDTVSTVIVAPRGTSGGSITIDTSYSIVLYKVDEETLKPLSGATFKVITPWGDEIMLDATDENGRTQSRQFTSAEAASGTFQVVEVTAPDGYKVNSDPIEVTIGSSGAVRTITNKLSENPNDSDDGNEDEEDEDDSDGGSDDEDSDGKSDVEEDEDSSDSASPETGDASNLPLYSGLFFAALLGAGLVSIRRKRAR